MNDQNANSNPNNNSSRCGHRTQTGRQCRQSTNDTNSHFCPRHRPAKALVTLPLRPEDDTADLAPHLAGDLTEFQSAAEVNSFLSKLAILLAQNRVSTRRAAVLGYLCNMILRAFSAIDKENAQSEDAEPQRLLIDFPPLDRTTHLNPLSQPT